MTTMNSQEDFLRALSENPEWRAAVRAQILGDELLQLPVKFDAFVTMQEQFNTDFTARLTQIEDTQRTMTRTQETMARAQETMARAQETMTRAQETMTTAQETLIRTQETMADTMKTMAADLAVIKGYHARDLAIPEAREIATDMGLQYVRTVPKEELSSMAQQAAGIVPTNQLRSFRRADLVIEASDGPETHYIAVEASFTADERETTRALRNAGFLTDFTGLPARAAIASVKNDRRIEPLVQDGTVYWHPLHEEDLVPE